MRRHEHDYIIVGAGSAGCVLANRLSANPSHRVCLLEAGPPDRNLLIHIPMGILGLVAYRSVNWAYQTEPQKQLNNRRLWWPRGKTLGGSSSINAMVYTRGHATDYDDWAKLGNSGWDYASVLPLFKRSQNQERGASDYHGVGGPLNVADLRSVNPLSQVFVVAGAEIGYSVNDDFNGAVQEGVGLHQVTQKNGRRCSAATAFLHPVKDRDNLDIHTGMLATKIVFDGRRAIGVGTRKKGQDQEWHADREVILCGGGINSPQLLLLSGIGPADELRAHGIDIVANLPGVGRNLQDHLDVTVLQQDRQRRAYGLAAGFMPRAIADVVRYIVKGRGFLTSNVAEAGGFVKSGPELSRPDLQFHFIPAYVIDHGRKHIYGYGYTLHVCYLRPKSTGTIKLNSPNPEEHPLIQPNYLEHPEDMECMVRGFGAMREVLAASAFDPYRGADRFPGAPVQSDAEIRAYIAAHAETIYHPVGACKMGNDDLAVVDEKLRVHNLEGLRVVDASIMPTLVGGNTNAPSIMIAEKAAEDILEGCD